MKGEKQAQLKILLFYTVKCSSWREKEEECDTWSLDTHLDTLLPTSLLPTMANAANRGPRCVRTITHRRANFGNFRNLAQNFELCRYSQSATAQGIVVCARGIEDPQTGVDGIGNRCVRVWTDNWRVCIPFFSVLCSHFVKFERRGSFSSVVLATHNETKKQYAIKVSHPF